ncbi:MAG TPA: hypothetical protein VGI00_10435 [Streptosporangiaceae bacterium]|jgi:hypothetical protein
MNIAEVAEITRRIRPLAPTAVDAMLAQAMAQHVLATLERGVPGRGLRTVSRHHL